MGAWRPAGYGAYDQKGGVAQHWRAWHGSLPTQKRDGSGLEYKRNRQYDPQTGRFTQQDPIGLAGGMNLYGYAGGDPVNRGDPFGLRADTIRVEGDRLKKVVAEERKKNATFQRIYDELDASTKNYVLISSELAPTADENHPGFTGFATRNDASIPPGLVLPDTFQRYWGVGTIAGALVGVNHPKLGQVVGHELVHLLGMERIGRIYLHPDATSLWLAFPIP